MTDDPRTDLGPVPVENDLARGLLYGTALALVCWMFIFAVVAAVAAIVYFW